MNVQYLFNLSLDPPLTHILARLGYKNRMTVINGQQKKFVDETINEGIFLCKPSACFVKISIKNKSENKIILENNEIFLSLKLTELLKNSNELYLMASTVGETIITKRDSEIKNNNASKALILDAVASEMADATLDWLVNYINTQIRRENKQLTKMRFSPGYGDLTLDNQKKIFTMLNLKNLGLHLTETFILVPEKSVTAIAGVEIIS